VQECRASHQIVSLQRDSVLGTESVGWLQRQASNLRAGFRRYVTPGFCFARQIRSSQGSLQSACDLAATLPWQRMLTCYGDAAAWTLLAMPARTPGRSTWAGENGIRVGSTGSARRA